MKNSAYAPKHTKPALTTEQAKALEFLRRFLRRGTKIYTLLRHVSAAGTCRHIDLYVVKENEPIRITWSAAVMLDWAYSKRWEALRVDGCGMDMGYHAVHTLSALILKDERALAHRWL